MRAFTRAILAFAASVPFRHGVTAANVPIPPELEGYFAAHPFTVTTNPPVQALTNKVKPDTNTLNGFDINTVKRINAASTNCPKSCGDTGSDPAAWAAYHESTRLAFCNETMLLDFALYTPIKDPKASLSIRACTARYGGNLPGAKSNASCLPSNGKRSTVEAPMQLAWSGPKNTKHVNDVVAAVQQLERYLTQTSGSCNESISFAYSGQAAVGFYAGSQLQSQGVSISVLREFVSYVKSNGVYDNLIAQLCTEKGRNTNYAIGIIANTKSDLAAVQDAVVSWNDGKCITAHDGTTEWQKIKFLAPSIDTSSNSTRSNSTITAKNVLRNTVHARGPCSTIKVKNGDSCASLAAECGISQGDLTKYNPNRSLCSTLAVGQHVCCSEGMLPEFRLKAAEDGTCATHYIKTGDTCSGIAASLSLTIEDLESFNKQTWGWVGCKTLYANSIMCVSKGYPPMPAPIENAVCGPQVPGTPVAPHGTDLSTLNTCPLNACCDIWGQCGTTAEFCTPSNSSTGNPGTAAPNTNGCISNCGTEIIMSDPPKEFLKIAYYEAFGWTRPCLRMPVGDLSANVGGYTHYFFSFATLNPDFSINLSDVYEQFLQFVTLKGVKRMISFGGWEFSTSPQTYLIFRESVKEGNRDIFVKNVIDLLKNYDLDGIDLDWEYPGAPDIPGIPPSTEQDSVNFFFFVNSLRQSINKEAPGKHISVTAPASYWYLKGIPIQAISLVSDIIVLMTYDLHGQWDYGNKFSQPGCPDGNCLRSHVNLTETINALSMVTKAGIPSNKISVGVTSYGRSFKMTQPGCYTELCTYTGKSSGARAGPCTGTQGYIANAEIAQVIAGKSSVTKQYVDDSNSNVLVYDDTEWVAYMDDSIKSVRTTLYKGLKFGGTADWAIDLGVEGGDSNGGNDGDIIISPNVWSSTSPEVACKPPCVLVQPPIPLSSPLTVTWGSYITSFLSSNGGSIKTVTSTYSVPPFTITAVSVWPVTIGQGEPNTGTWIPVQSIKPPSIVIQLPPFQAPISPTPYPTGTITSTPSSSSSSTTLVPIFFTTSRPVTLQPHPTRSITIPTPFRTPTVTFHSSDKPHPTDRPGCKGCGDRDCRIFGCGGGCGLFGCGGGCGIFGCGGGCGLFGCHGTCPLRVCGGGGGGGDGENNPTSCEMSTTVSDCRVACSVTADHETLKTSCYTTFCSQTVGCELMATTSTSRTTVGCPSLPPYRPWYTNEDQPVPTAGDPNWGGQVIATGTYSGHIGGGGGNPGSSSGGGGSPTSSGGGGNPSSSGGGGNPGSSSGGGSTPTPSPMPTSHFAVYAHKLIVVNRGSSLTTWDWQGFDLPLSYDGADVCSKSKQVVKGGFFPAGEKYPEKLEKFKLGNHSNCNYSGSKDNVGKVKCDGGFELDCISVDASHKNDPPTVDCPINPAGTIARDDYYLQLYCPYR